MPAEHSSGSGLIKIISFQPDGWELGVPSIGGGVLWIDGLTGRIAAMLDAAALTALRTGAASGLATSLLASPSSRVLAMLGAGDQAADQVAGVCAVRPIREIRVYSRRRARSAALCERLRAAHPGVTVAPAARSPGGGPRRARHLHRDEVGGAAVRGGRPGAGRACQRHRRVPAGHVRGAAGGIPAAGLVVIDQLEAALAEAGDLVQALNRGDLHRADLVEIGHLLAGPGRPARPRTTAARSVAHGRPLSRAA